MARGLNVDFMTLLDRELRKTERAPSTPYIDAVRESVEFAKESRAWNERKNMQRQQIMGQLAQGTSMTFSDEDLKSRKDRFQTYYNKHKGSMDESTLEMGQMMLDDFDIQGKKNKDFNFLIADGEQLKKDIMYDMQNIGVDEEGNQRTLNENDYEIITKMQSEWIDHISKMQTGFADRLSLKPFQHINTELANATNMNQFLLGQAREDNLIDDRELQAYSDAWNTGSLDPIEKYNNDEKAGRASAIAFNTEELLTGAKRYKDLYNFYVNDGVMPYKDQASGQTINLTHAQIKEQGPTTDQLLGGLLNEYNSLPQQLRNLNSTNIDLTGTDFLKTADLSLHEIPPNIRDQILAGDKTILDVSRIKKTTDEPTGRAQKIKKAAGISDNDMSAIGKLGIGVGFAGAAYQGKNIAKLGAKVADVTVKAGKYVEELTHLYPNQITEFLSSKDVGANLGRIETLETDITELESKIKNTKGLDKITAKDRLQLRRNEAVIKKKTAKIDKIKDSMSQRWAKKFSTKKRTVKPRVIRSLFKKGTTDKWNLWKAKAGLPKLGQRYAIGSILTDKVFGFEFEGAARVATDIGAGYATEKMVTKNFFPALVKMIKSPAGKKHLAKFVTTTAAKKIGAAALAGGGYLSVATSLIGAGLAAKDIYHIIKSWNPEEGEE